jgi:hypothetical protein
MIKAVQLSYITGAYFSGKGYYCEISPEIPDFTCSPDVIAIKPRLPDVRLRFEKGGAPVGLIYLLWPKKWISTELILKKTGYKQSFVESVLKEAEENGWIKSRMDSQGKPGWEIDKYRVPASECLMVMCAAENPEDALKTLDALAGAYHRAYLTFPYPVDKKFVHECEHHGIGIMVFNEEAASFHVQLPAVRRRVTAVKAYSSLCEKIVLSHNMVV